MAANRPALRLHEKVAAESRRLAGLGGRPNRWALPVAALVAVAVHAGALLVPLPEQPVHVERRSPRPDLPAVWRWGPPIDRDVPAAPPSRETPERPTPAVAAAASRLDDDHALEPVPESPIDLAGTIPPAQIEALIPAPDSLPPSRGAGGPQPTAAQGDIAGSAPIDLTPVKNVRPSFPELARTTRAEGTVSLIATVAVDGAVLDARVVECSRPGVGFEQSALAAVKRWRYAPVPSGRPLRLVVVHIDFRSSEAGR